jgi:DNA-binding SARP family transcriptional activator
LAKPCNHVVVRIQLHGRFTVEIDGQFVDGRLPGRRGRLLVAYLASHSRSAVERSTVIDMLWEPDGPGPGAAATFAALLSKTRNVLAPGEIHGRASLHLVLPDGALVDSDYAAAALHDAESAAARHDWRRAWAQALSAIFVLQRGFLPEFDAAWVVHRRAEFGYAYARALACYAEACLELGGVELASAERSARRLIDADPLAERGYCLLMRALARRGDQAAALAVYDQLRRVLRDELGTSPSQATRELHQSLL